MGRSLNLKFYEVGKAFVSSRIYLLLKGSNSSQIFTNLYSFTNLTTLPFPPYTMIAVTNYCRFLAYTMITVTDHGAFPPYTITAFIGRLW
jgi:hypothetical protein